MTINASPYPRAMQVGSGGVLEQVPFLPSDLTSCWAWAWSGASDANITTEIYGGSDECIDTCDNLADGTNNFFNNDSQDNRHGRPLYSTPPQTVDGGAYTAPHAALGKGDSSSTPQYMYQSTDMGATGEFYIAFAVYMQRSTGERWFVGDAASPSNGVRIESTSRYIDIYINSTPIRVAGNNSVEDASVIEIWRDSSNNLTCLVNGVDVTNGTPSSTATFGISGYGGGSASGGSGLDDWLFELVYCDGLPTAEERYRIRQDINARWDNLF